MRESLEQRDSLLSSKDNEIMSLNYSFNQYRLESDKYIKDLTRQLEHYQAKYTEMANALAQEQESNAKQAESIHSYYKFNQANDKDNAVRLEKEVDALKQRLADLNVRLIQTKYYKQDALIKQERQNFTRTIEDLSKNKPKEDPLLNQLKSEVEQYKYDIKLLKEQVVSLESSDLSLRQELSKAQTLPRFEYLDGRIQSLSELCNALSEENSQLKQRFHLT